MGTKPFRSSQTPLSSLVAAQPLNDMVPKRDGGSAAILCPCLLQEWQLAKGGKSRSCTFCLWRAAKQAPLVIQYIKLPSGDGWRPIFICSSRRAASVGFDWVLSRPEKSSRLVVGGGDEMGRAEPRKRGFHQALGCGHAFFLGGAPRRRCYSKTYVLIPQESHYH